MDEAFYTSDQVSKETLRKLILRSHQPALLRFIVMYVLVIVVGIWAVLAWGTTWWNVALSQIAYAVMVCSTFARLHETAHGTAFKSKRLNRVAAFLCGLVHLYPSILFFHLVLVLLAVFVDSRFWALLVGQVVGHCLLAAYLTPEHNGLPHDGNILAKTRSMDTNLGIKLVMWNMPYHAEHHAFPAVPFHALPNLHDHIQDELRHQQVGYAKFHRQVLSGKQDR